MHPEPELLLQQAAALVAGQPDQTALRTAANRAYYAVFHHVLRYVTDSIVGERSRDTNLYRSVYRHVQHEQLRTLCNRLAGPRRDIKIKRYEPGDTFGQIINFAGLILNLYDQREHADYDPVYVFDDEAGIARFPMREPQFNALTMPLRNNAGRSWRCCFSSSANARETSKLREFLQTRSNC
jgi:hypothetical protein